MPFVTMQHHSTQYTQIATKYVMNHSEVVVETEPQNLVS